MRAVVVSLLVVASPAAAQDFYSPRDLSADTDKKETYEQGVEQCWEFSVGGSARRYTFSLSGSAGQCAPVDGQLALYPPDALDPSVWMALVDTREGDECVALERRLTTGDYVICAATLLNETKDMVLEVSNTTAPPTPSNDRCGAATPLVGPSGSLSNQDLRSAAHDYSPIRRGACAAASGAKGPDRVWSVELDSGEAFVVDVDPSVGNPTIYLLSDCGRWWNACVAASALPGAATESLSYTNEGPSNRFFLVVDTPRQTSATFAIQWSVVSP